MRQTRSSPHGTVKRARDTNIIQVSISAVRLCSSRKLPVGAFNRGLCNLFGRSEWILEISKLKQEKMRRSGLGEEQRGKWFRQRKQHWTDFEVLKGKPAGLQWERQEPDLWGLIVGLVSILRVIGGKPLKFSVCLIFCFICLSREVTQSLAFFKDHSRHYVQNGGEDAVQIYVEKPVRRQLEEMS